jgi:hypothetical protein
MPPQVLARELAHRDGRGHTTSPTRAKHSLVSIEKIGKGDHRFATVTARFRSPTPVKHTQMGTCVPGASCIWSEQGSQIPFKKEIAT